MINVYYNRKYRALKVEGHAYSGEAGHDLVCSAASILAYTFASAVCNAEKHGQIRKDPYVRMDNGAAEIRCTPTPRMEAVVTLMLDTVCAGFELLSRNYPENISYEIH